MTGGGVCSGQGPPDNRLRPPLWRHSSPKSNRGKNHPESSGFSSGNGGDALGLAGAGSREPAGPSRAAGRAGDPGEAQALSPTLTAAAPLESDHAQSPGPTTYRDPSPPVPVDDTRSFRKRHIRRPPCPLPLTWDWKLLEARTELTVPYSPRQKKTLEQTAAPYYNAPTAQGPQSSNLLTLLKSNYNPIKAQNPTPQDMPFDLVTGNVQMLCSEGQAFTHGT
ncbi:uncharacterized protein [Desmodus rotundus]|uniref:uncharacterized protein n=1 Tax=Desmodus rotundus TaxID=9430 RepID=UPI00238146E7|nr:uncharacterized protein LOC128780915 [Desmodus rotundus]